MSNVLVSVSVPEELVAALDLYLAKRFISNPGRRTSRAAFTREAIAAALASEGMPVPLQRVAIRQRRRPSLIHKEGA